MHRKNITIREIEHTDNRQWWHFVLCSFLHNFFNFSPVRSILDHFSLRFSRTAVSYQLKRNIENLYLREGTTVCQPHYVRQASSRGGRSPS